MSFQTAPLFPGDLLDAATRFAADVAADATARSGPDAAAGPDLSAAWAQAVQMGWPALLIDEVLGGPGGSLADLGAVLEGAARHALPLPLVRRCAQVPGLLMALGAAAEPALRGLASGELDIDPADGSALQVLALADGGVRLSGALEGLDAGLPASHRLVVAGDCALLIPDAALPKPAERYLSIDGRRSADLQLHGLELPAAAVLARGPAVATAEQAAADLAVLAISIEMTATLGASVEHTIAYLLQRQQFGVALASFQVMRHRVVDLYVDQECASALVARLVADSLARGQIAPRDAALAKLYLNQLARRAAEASIQLHGGMGMTAELPATRLARRLIVTEFEHGHRAHQLRRLAALA
jgi:alkylation response protein AidB-like acyl-CoA dehydrogenase